MAVFWDVALCSLVDIALMMEAVSSSETSVHERYHISLHNESAQRTAVVYILSDRHKAANLLAVCRNRGVSLRENI
jgi:hypothetical protein